MRVQRSFDEGVSRSPTETLGTAARLAETSRLLLVGPLPPPLDGTSVSFELLCRELARTRPEIDVRVIDTSGKRLKHEGSSLTPADGLRALRVMARVCCHVWRADRLVIFGSNGFLARLAPPMVRVARLAGVPCYVRPFGGSLAEYCEDLPPARRERLLGSLRSCDGVIAQTRLLQAGLGEAIGRSVGYLPGYRMRSSLTEDRSDARGRHDDLRLVFLGHVREEKGAGVLLESLRELQAQGERVHCDFFGPIYGGAATELETKLRESGSASHRGILPQNELWSTLASYDALVLPTYYQGEGHPGVLIEAMAAGLPIITTRFRSIPDLVEDGVNGLLVPPGDAKSLAAAIRALAGDRDRLRRMAAASRARGPDFDVRSLLPRFLDLISAGLRGPE
jgi:glycosyltransferase involved in cell wall biosynthesis